MGERQSNSEAQDGEGRARQRTALAGMGLPGGPGKPNSERYGQAIGKGLSRHKRRPWPQAAKAAFIPRSPFQGKVTAEANAGTKHPKAPEHVEEPNADT